MTRSKHYVMTLLVALALAACGGGGGGGGAGEPQAPGGNVDAPADLPTAAVTLMTPEAGSTEAGALGQLNSWRSLCGFTSLPMAENLNQSAASHASVVLRQLFAGSPSALSVEEPPEVFGFSGVTVEARQRLRGYAPTASGETLLALNIGDGTTPQAEDEAYGRLIVRALASNPAQMAELFRPWEHMGLGITTMAAAAPGTFNMGYVMDFGATRSTSDVAAAAVQTFPCNGVTNVVPDVAVHRGLRAEVNPTGLGAPVYVRTRAGSTLAVAAASATDGLTTVALNRVASASLSEHEAVLVANTALAANTTYTVALTLLVDGATVNRSFQFTTGKSFDAQMQDNLFVK